MSRRQRGKPPGHYNPRPMFGLRVVPSRTERVIVALVQMAGEHGIVRERLSALLYMADIHAREYLGYPLTDIRWTREHLTERQA